MKRDAIAAQPFWVPLEAKGRLATMARPPGGTALETSLNELVTQGITGLVSLLSLQEVESSELSHEGQACEERGLSFRAHPLPDFGVPPDEAAF